MNAIRANRRRGFSLIELLCVIAIISILVSLIAGPALRALRRAKEMNAGFEGPGVAEIVETRLKNFFRPMASYPPFSADDLRKKGVFDSEMMRRIRTKEVIYHPFASNDPADPLIAEVLVEVRRQSAVYQSIFKKDLYAEER